MDKSILNRYAIPFQLVHMPLGMWKYQFGTKKVVTYKKITILLEFFKNILKYYYIKISNTDNYGNMESKPDYHQLQLKIFSDFVR